LTPDRTQMPRRTVRPSDAALRAEEAERARPLAVRLADRRFAKWVLLALAALELVNGVLVLVHDTNPDVQPEFSPWITVPLRFLLSAVVYFYCHRGVRVAWWFAWIRIGLGVVAAALSLSESFDVGTLAFGIAFLAFGVVLVAHPRLVAFRRDCRQRRPFA
jgi:hypothetical protein